MKIQNNLNIQDKLKLNDSNNNSPLNNNNFHPLVQTPFSFIKVKKPEGINTNNFQELIRPAPFPLFYSINNNLLQKNYLSNFNFCLNFNNINLNRSIKKENNLSFKGNIQFNSDEFFLPNIINYENNKEDLNKNKNILQKAEQFNENKNLILNENDTNFSLTINNGMIIGLNNELEIIGKSFSSNKLFIINKKRKRGRYIFNNIENKNRRIHDCHSSDNILRKIQIYYLNYIISFTNDLVKTFSNHNYLQFKKLNYQIKSKINNAFVKRLKEMKIRDILKLPISSKYCIYYIDINKRIFEKVSNLYPFLNDYFNMTYLEVFNKFYIKSEKVINFEGKNIYLSEKTKVFSDLLEKNKSIAGKIQILVENNFVKKKNKNLFIIQK